MRRPLLVANWKMNLGRAEEARAHVRRLRPALGRLSGLEVVVCPPFTVLVTLAEILEQSPLGLGAQDLHAAPAGAHTGEIAPGMLAPLCDYVIVGHSERRAAGESDADVARKVVACLDHGMSPIICVGDNADEHAAGRTDRVVSDQVRAALESVRPENGPDCVIAYEPVWAIGTGSPATPAAANRTMGMAIRGCAAEMWGEPAAAGVRLLYGGSVSAESVAGFMVMPDIDGALVGGASLSDEFAALARNAAAALD